MQQNKHIYIYIYTAQGVSAYQDGASSFVWGGSVALSTATPWPDSILCVRIRSHFDSHPVVGAACGRSERPASPAPSPIAPSCRTRAVPVPGSSGSEEHSPSG